MICSNSLISRGADQETPSRNSRWSEGRFRHPSHTRLVPHSRTSLSEPTLSGPFEIHQTTLCHSWRPEASTGDRWL